MTTVNLLTKLSMATAGAAVIALGAAGTANAGSLTTTFTSNNGQAGNMFDVTTFGNDLKVTSLEINAYTSFTNGLLNVYTKAGSYVGSETNPGDWTLVSSNIISSSAGTNIPTFVDVTDFLLAANSTTGIWATFDRTYNGTSGSAGLNYTNGSNTYTNSDLQIITGVGISSPLGSVFTNRTWNGTINYDVVTQAVPEPASLMGILGLGAFGFTSLRKRKQVSAVKA